MGEHNFKELKIWQQSMMVVKRIYTITKLFPKEETFGLTQQMRRSAVSIPSNIAEGCGRNSNLELKHFLVIARGSAYELETQLIIAKSLKYGSDTIIEQTIEQIRTIQKMINGFKSKF